nr:MAG TPA: hypothetical protein [Caudoviricetes sp.]
MALCREIIECGKPYRGFISKMKPRAGEHKWRKNQMNRWFRRRMRRDFDYNPKRQYSGWEV